ncbi:hypothetical protein [Amycolatopsis sp.]|uniref:hypothetical protein n=1 Tax=Amycolatopsis sp. TaxID=37632 RepID=UPI002B7A80F7|nr:hypothetical protein [Amycolatopsis sp.]HVV09074.1 hypothetical protein [Amycolatopsis sp.]
MKFRKVVAASVAAAAGVLALGAFGSTAMAAENPQSAPVANTVHVDTRCDCLPGPAAHPRPAKPAKPAKPAPAPATPAAPAPSKGSVTCPAKVPENPTGADYVNAWNQSGTCFGAGAAGLVSSAWAGAIPSIVQGALGAAN